MLAAQGGHTETVKALIKAGADVNLRNRVSPGNLYYVHNSATFGPLQFGRTAQMLATHGGYTGTIETLTAAGALPIAVIKFLLEMDINFNFNSILMQLKHNVAAADDFDLQGAHPWSIIEVSVIVWIFTRNNHAHAIVLCISL